MKTYQIYVESKSGDGIELSGWFDIEPSRLSNPEKLQEYIDKGLIKENISFSCQRDIEGSKPCLIQCDNCFEQYKYSQRMTLQESQKFEFLMWLSKRDLITDKPMYIWQDYIKNNSK